MTTFKKFILTLHGYWKVICYSKILLPRIVKPAIYLTQGSLKNSCLKYYSARAKRVSHTHRLCGSVPNGRERKAKWEVTSYEGHRRDASRHLTFRHELSNDARQVSLHFEPSINPHFRGAPRFIIFFSYCTYVRNHLRAFSVSITPSQMNVAIGVNPHAILVHVFMKKRCRCTTHRTT